MGYMNAPLNIYESFGHYFLKGIFFLKTFLKVHFGLFNTEIGLRSTNKYGKY